MPGAVGISRLALPGSNQITLVAFSANPSISKRPYFLCRCLHQQTLRTVSLPVSYSKPGTRTFKSTSLSHKRNKYEKRTGRTDSGSGPRGKARFDHPVDSLSNRSSGDFPEHRVRRPAYVKAHSVSGSQIVQAIESSRQESLSKLDDGINESSSTDPFGNNGADPFANKLEAAIEASLRNTNRRHRNHKNDIRHDRANTLPVAEKQIPDIQAQYLVGYARWESVKAKDVEIKNVTPESRPKVAALEHGLDRVLFNPGVHWLQDPRSSVFNFDPYLRTICQPKDFDYNALPAYKTSSMDPELLRIAQTHNGKYIGSTSSMTSILSQFYFLISGWKPLKTNHLSEAFTSQPKGFTKLSRTPTTIDLVHKGNGVYAIDADKTYDSSTILMQLGKSMEKMLTCTPEEFSRFTKENSWKVTAEERNQPEAFNYISVDNFLLRSQLDCEDSRLPGKTFDLKTRAAVAIRLDVHNYELNQGYQLSKAHGYLESFEREYYDMMRSAFLKYSLQVRIGQMDGIFVAFHNTAKIFGFQYISLDEMDSRLFGSSVMGDECFRNQLRLLNRTLDEITTKYPNQDLRITVDTDESVQSMNVWVETLPLGARTSSEGLSVVPTFDENGALEMQPGAELSLWQIVCYSNINNTTVIGPFDLSERATDDWELRYKIAELKKPHMMSEYRRMKGIQAEVLLDDVAKEMKAIELGEQDSEDKNESRAISKRDQMKNTLRRISQEGRLKEEDAVRKQGDKKFLIWEPKGYIKISELKSYEATAPSKAMTPVAAAPVVDIPLLDKQGGTITASMARKLKGLAAKTIMPSSPITAAATALSSTAVTSPAASVATVLATDSEVKDTESTKPYFSKYPPSIFYHDPQGKKKMDMISRKDLEFIHKSYLDQSTLSDEDSKRFDALARRHKSLISSLTPFDKVRFDFLKIPHNSNDYAFLDTPTIHQIAERMGVNPDGFENTKALGRALYKTTARYRCNLYLEFYHKWMHKLLFLNDDATPLKDYKEFLAIEDEAALKRCANAIIIPEKFLSIRRKLLGNDRKEALKKAILEQVYMSEKKLADEELESMGFLPRIFDPKDYSDLDDYIQYNELSHLLRKKKKADDQESLNPDVDESIEPMKKSEKEKEEKTKTKKTFANVVPSESMVSKDEEPENTIVDKVPEPETPNVIYDDIVHHNNSSISTDGGEGDHTSTRNSVEEMMNKSV
ncbi:hypothetical protein FBU30_000469 [Linnemannia zychae]|nr:hypothetical protein FBU30_000469 [Linnemannia zychae]